MGITSYQAFVIEFHLNKAHKGIEAMMSELIEKEKITRVLNNYARACDQRNWPLFDDIFTEDVDFNYGGEYQAKGRSKLVKLIKNSLGGCGPTQHLLGNFAIDINGDNATCSCYVRAYHVGLGAKKDIRYEVWGEYKDNLVRSFDSNNNGAWKICDRKMLITYESPGREVLGPVVT